jgi:hypothetical protein
MEEAEAQTIWSSLEASGIAVAMREWTWLYPIVEIAHILGFVVLVGSAFMFDLRLLGVSRGLPVTQLANHLLRWSRLSILVVVPTGFLMFMTNASKLVENPVFRAKLVLIVLAGINALVFWYWTSSSVEHWNVQESSTLAAKFSAVFSLVVWSAVISCGRLIAFF